MQIFEDRESNVRSYSRSFPDIFDKAFGSFLYNQEGVPYLDFFSGAGALNYGHNNPIVQETLIKYLSENRIVHSLDKATVAKSDFLDSFSTLILKPRNLSYKIQFTGPTGTNAVEAALKLSRMVKNRRNIIAFTNAYHGVSIGALAATGNAYHHHLAYSNRFGVSHLPFDGYLGTGIDSTEYIRKVIEDASSGIDLPAAILVETIQCEGGINVASLEWLKNLQNLCHELDILLIIDDIQVGNGRTGRFFSFEDAGIQPDIVCLSKSIGGGLPMSILLIGPEIDQWEPGKHNGTFRGNNLAFAAATALLQHYWTDDSLQSTTLENAERIEKSLDTIARNNADLNLKIRGKGMVWGIEFSQADFARRVSQKAFEEHLLIERCGNEDQVVKILPPLTTEASLLQEGLDKIAQIIEREAAYSPEYQ